MERKTVYFDQDGVRRSLITDDNEPNRIRTYTEVDVDRLVENNKILAQEWEGDKSTNKLLARVPMTIYEQSIHEDWDDARWKRWLNDPDNAAFRVWKGRV